MRERERLLYQFLALFSSMCVHNLQYTQVMVAKLLLPDININPSDIAQEQLEIFTLNTMCSSMLSPAFPGYLVAMLPGVKSNIFAPVSVQMAWASIFLPTPLGPAIINDLICGAFS